MCLKHSIINHNTFHFYDTFNLKELNEKLNQKEALNEDEEKNSPCTAHNKHEIKIEIEQENNGKVFSFVYFSR